MLGGRRLCVTGEATADRLMEIDGMAVFAVEEGEADTIVYVDCNLTMPECRWVYEFDFPDAGCRCRYGEGKDGFGVFTFGGEEFLLFDSRRPDRVEVTTVEDLTRLRFMLWMAVALTGAFHKMTLIHSSTVVYGGRGVLFLGESGTGKSTHTRLWLKHIEGARLLNDDSPLIGLSSAGEVMVWGSPWSGKTPCYRQEGYPVAAIVRLEQRPENAIRRLPVLEAFGALQPSCPPALAHSEVMIDRIVGLISDVLLRVPVYRLGCLPDRDAAMLSFRTVFQRDGKEG